MNPELASIVVSFENRPSDDLRKAELYRDELRADYTRRSPLDIVLEPLTFSDAGILLEEMEAHALLRVMTTEALHGPATYDSQNLAEWVEMWRSKKLNTTETWRKNFAGFLRSFELEW